MNMKPNAFGYSEIYFRLPRTLQCLILILNHLACRLADARNTGALFEKGFFSFVLVKNYNTLLAVKSFALVKNYWYFLCLTNTCLPMKRGSPHYYQKLFTFCLFDKYFIEGEKGALVKQSKSRSRSSLKRRSL